MSRLLVVPGLTLLVAFPGSAEQERESEETAPPPITVEAVTVEPSDPGPDTLCRLTVELDNTADRVISQLGFTVTINGQELPVYANQLFMFPVEPGSSAELALYNFWTTETSRPMPADGKLLVAVTLREASWMEISVDEEGVEVWKPLGAVEGLPSSAEITLTLAGAPASS